MISLTPFQIIELIIGFFTFWVGAHQLSQNIKSSFSWLIFFLFFACGVVIFTDPILVNTPDVRSYIIWQKITDWPLFFLPAFCLSFSIYTCGLSQKLKAYRLSAYAFAIFLFFADIRGGLVLKENIIRFDDFRRVDGYAPGILLIPFVVFCIICFSIGIYYFNLARKTNKEYRYFYPIAGSIILALGAVFTGTALYVKILSAQTIFSAILIAGISPNVYFILSYYQLVNNERNIFDRNFLYRTAVLLLIIMLYLATFLLGRKELTYLDIVFIVLLPLLIITSHSLYDWTNTFINDLLYNHSSGLSVVNDQEVGEAIKNYNSPERLENSSLLRLNALKRNKDRAPVDALRSVIKEAIDYFKPENDKNRRTKRNLKYHLLTMIAFDQAEEGQILWELGFEEYPVRIMTKETKDRPPMFKSVSPSDYTYLSRNAFIALKKEAIHDVTWRISYLEKLSKKKLI